MSDPRRWLDSNGDATPLERELLAREAAAAPRSDLAGAVWQKIAVALPPVGNGSPDTGADGAGGDWGVSGAGLGAQGAAGGASAGAGLGGASAGAGAALGFGAKAGAIGITKALVIGAVAGAAVVTGTVELGRSRAPAADPPSEVRVENAAERPHAVPPATTKSRAVVPATPAASSPARSSLSRTAVLDQPAPSTRGASSARFDEPPGSSALASRTRAERLALERARGALRRGDPAGALGLLEGSKGEGGGGVLAQEREVLAIEALSSAGRHAEARSRARAFLTRFPESPHNSHVSQFAR